jgi:hypothetical protein
MTFYGSEGCTLRQRLLGQLCNLTRASCIRYWNNAPKRRVFHPTTGLAVYGVRRQSGATTALWFRPDQSQEFIE